MSEHQSVCDGGEMLECLLYGDILENFVIEEIQYILNLNNWSQDWNSFRKFYMSIRKNLKQPLVVSRRLMRRLSGFGRVGFCGNKRNK